jgi:hypothetical protein
MNNIECNPTINLFRLPITGVDTGEDTDQLAKRIIHEWRRTRDEWRPEMLMVDLNADLCLYRMLKAEGLPVSALPEDESRNRHSAQNRPYSECSKPCERRSQPSQHRTAVQVATHSSQSHRQRNKLEAECSSESAIADTSAPSRRKSLKRILLAQICLIRVPYHKVASFLGWRGVKGISLENDERMHHYQIE